MTGFNLIPATEAVPAPPLIFLIFGIITFALHILFINIILGGSLIGIFTRFRGKPDLSESLYGSLVGKIPFAFALGINLGVAPLLFLQVVYGHFFYTSSILMAVLWILVIPFLMFAYYGSYILLIKGQTASRFFLQIIHLFTVFFLLYIAFIFVNNMTLMLQPEKWQAYFSNRKGLILNLSDPVLWPRFLHFLTASIAVSALFSAIIRSKRKSKNSSMDLQKIKSNLKIFSIATIIQVFTGFWFFISLPEGIKSQFLGSNAFATIFLVTAIILTVSAVISGFKNRLTSTAVHLVFIILIMSTIRAQLRFLYLKKHFTLSQLNVSTQTGVMLFFFLFLIAGLAIIGFMLKIASKSKEGKNLP